VVSIISDIHQGAEPEWIVIHADNITGYTIDCACNLRLEDVEVETRLVRDEPEVVAVAVSDDGGKDISDMNAEKVLAERESIDRWMDALPF